MKASLLSVITFAFASVVAIAQVPFDSDVLATSTGELKITFIGHGTLMFAFNDKSIYVDPYGKLANYADLPKADAILITHEHGDHLDPSAIQTLSRPDTVVVMTAGCEGKTAGVVMTNGAVRTVLGVKVEAVPAYNILHKRDNGQLFHPRGTGNGYILTFGDK